MTTRYVLEHLAVFFGAAAGVGAGRGKGVDLIGVIVLGLVTSLGGGTLRDLTLDLPVFWTQDSRFLWTATSTSLVLFVYLRYFRFPPKLLMIADAFSLAGITMLGCSKALAAGFDSTVALVMGVVTGVAGGVLRDVLCGEVPMVFRPHLYLYATASIAGAIVYLALTATRGQDPAHLVLGASVILALRLVSIHYQWKLPVFQPLD